jgi:hypothetical protein
MQPITDRAHSEASHMSSLRLQPLDGGGETAKAFVSRVVSVPSFTKWAEVPGVGVSWRLASRGLIRPSHAQRCQPTVIDKNNRVTCFVTYHDPFSNSVPFSPCRDTDLVRTASGLTVNAALSLYRAAL